jgi:hypothetical protein
MGTPHCLTILARHGPGHFTAELSGQVPYGETWESVQFTAFDAETSGSSPDR